MEIVLRRGRLLAGGKFYRAGDVIPDGPDARDLVARGDAEAVAPPEPAPSPSTEGPAGGTAEGYGDRTVRELVEMVKARGLDVPRGATKAALAAILDEDDARHGPDEDDGYGDP